MNADLYNYDLLYGNGLAAQSYNPNNSYIPRLNTTNPAVLPEANLNSNSGIPSWLPKAEVVGTLGLGLASFLDQRKTADLQRQALRQNLNMSREHQANRRALGDSWNKAWGQ